MPMLDNDVLRKALEACRANLNNETLGRAGRALMDTKVMIPARWDKEPIAMKDGQMQFAPDTKITVMVAENKNGMKMYPFFTSEAEVKKFFGDRKVKCLVMGSDQFVPMLEQSDSAIEGIVVDPAGVNFPFKSKLIIDLKKNYKSPVKPETIKKGESVYLKNPEGDHNQLEAELISCGFHEPSIKSIYLKERLETANPEEGKTHWFILIDTDEKDTGLFKRISQQVRPYVEGKDLEFMFADSKLGQDIMKTSSPLYTKSFH